ncbi:aspartate dehydrogenase [Luteithermobacter gelatinilyticus]|uniref:aspartate dehydrogenase n=1 Tax=Luteithermobacter gelatinilyticus TaxID=2582913 RepID=UPI001106C41E|nr:aspartate dehydrogenase [Luteithermobacter gelatinilyticus]
MKVGIAGFGTIGKAVGRALDQGVEHLTLVGVCTRTPGKALATMADFTTPVPVVSAKEMAEMADIIVECAPTAVFMDIAGPALKAGKTLVTVSGAAVLAHPEVIDLARDNGGKIILATGALLGLDAVRAAAEGTIHSVRMVTRKPPKSLAGADYIVKNNINIATLDEPLRIFSGTARDGAQKFPSNVNVAAALGLAGVGPDKTYLEIWADPTKDRNTHTIFVDADSARFELTIENIPTEENPGTGKITALSVIAALRGLVAPLRVGT